jgi:hypothetical protein
MVYPFDVYTHLGWIDKQNLNTLSPAHRETWHYIWAYIFDIFHISKNAIFQRAAIIHYTQFIITFGIIFYLSRVVFQILFKSISFLSLHYLAYWSTLIWLTIYANFSVHYQQVWIAWYSVNYQITLPLTLLTLALTLSMIFNPYSKVRKTIYTIVILIFSYFIIKIHAMEYIYFLMYLSILLLVHVDIIFKYIRQNLLLSSGVMIFFTFAGIEIIYLMKDFIYRDTPLLKYLSIEKFPLLMAEIKKHGTHVLQYYNKATTIINELIVVSLFLILLFTILFFYRRVKHMPLLINVRMLIFLGITSLFILIPLFTYSAGLASLLTYDTVSYRFYYSALIFLMMPAFVYYLFTVIQFPNLLIINTVIILTLGFTLYYSKNLSKHANYYTNVHSLQNMFSKEKMHFNLHQTYIGTIGTLLEGYEKEYKQTKPLYYYARDDIAFVLRFVYQKSVFYKQKGTKDYQKSYSSDHNASHKAILFETPSSFPHYKRFY